MKKHVQMLARVNSIAYLCCTETRNATAHAACDSNNPTGHRALPDYTETRERSGKSACLLHSYKSMYNLSNFGEYYNILCSLESHFEVKKQKSAHIDPCTACYRLHLVLEKPPVSGLVVPRVETVLEDGRLDIVPFLPLVEGDGLHLAPDLGLVYLVASEVPPALLAVLALDLDLPFVVLHGDGGEDLARLPVGDLEGVLACQFKVEARRLALYAVGRAACLYCFS